MKLTHWAMFSSLCILQIFSSFKTFASQPIPEELVGYDIVHDFSTGFQQTTRSGVIAPVPTNPDQQQYLKNLSNVLIYSSCGMGNSPGHRDLLVTKPTHAEDQIISNTQFNFSLSCSNVVSGEYCRDNNPRIIQVSCTLSSVTYEWGCNLTSNGGTPCTFDFSKAFESSLKANNL